MEYDFNKWYYDTVYGIAPRFEHLRADVDLYLESAKKGIKYYSDPFPDEDNSFFNFSEEDKNKCNTIYLSKYGSTVITQCYNLSKDILNAEMLHDTFKKLKNKNEGEYIYQTCIKKVTYLLQVAKIFQELIDLMTEFYCS